MTDSDKNITATGSRSVAAQYITGLVVTGDDATIDSRTITLGPDSTLIPPASVRAISFLNNLPRTPRSVFVGREDLWSAIVNFLSAQPHSRRLAFCGLGGIGKTELALQYANSQRSHYSVCWWLVAESSSQIQSGLASLAGRLQPSVQLAFTTAGAADWAIGWLQSHDDWLLIIDNVSDPQLIQPLLGQLHNGFIIITTRRDFGWEQLGVTTIHLGLLAPGASTELIQQITRQSDSKSATYLSEELGHLPLALQQACAYLNQGKLSLRDYLAQWREYPRESVATLDIDSSSQAISRTWAMSIATIAEGNCVAPHLLAMISWLGPEQLPRDTLILPSISQVEVNSALGILASYSMISLSSSSVSVHRIVQLVTRYVTTDKTSWNSLIRSNGGSSLDLPTPSQNALTLLVDAIPEDPWGNVAGWNKWRTLTPHIHALARNDPSDVPVAEFSYLLDQIAVFHHGQGQADEAVSFHEKALALREITFGSSHQLTLNSQNNLAYALRAAGAVDNAIEVFKTALEEEIRTLGRQHVMTLTTANGLAFSYGRSGQLIKALPLLEETLLSRQQTLGDLHPHTMISRNNLALVYLALGWIPKAVEEFKRTLAQRKNVSGAEHPATLAVENGLALALRSAGRVDEAIRMLEKVYEGRVRVLGRDHSYTLHTLADIVCARWSAGHSETDRESVRLVFLDCERALGRRHSLTLSLSDFLEDESGYWKKRIWF